MGLEVDEDDSAKAAGAAAGNLYARIPGRSERSVLLCAHLDTVSQNAPIEPALVDGGWENVNDGILGADNKAAVAVILELARRATVEGSPVGLELLFTVCEENGLQGAKYFDAGRLRSQFGYVFDHATPIGEVITASPTYFRIARRVPRARRARGAQARGRPQRRAGRRHGDHRDAARPHRPRHDRQRRLGVGRRRLHQRGARAREAARGGALAGPRARRGRRRRDDRRDPGRRRVRRVRRRRHDGEDVRRLPAEAVLAGGRRSPRRRSAPAATSRGGCRPAAARTPTRSRPRASRA